ncbi:hypothetical protein PI125_g3927 [Phytophthora idaei]|nr:hypothetical protein PI125_g3927 [Phytophthora idaei]
MAPAIEQEQSSFTERILNRRKVDAAPSRQRRTWQSVCSARHELS